MNCSISEKAIEALRTKVAKDLLSMPSDSLNLKQYIQTIYEFVLESTKGDVNKAFDAARLVPLFIEQIRPFDTTIAAVLRQSGISLDVIDELKIKFINEDTGFVAISEYITPKANKAEEIEKLNKEVADIEIEETPAEEVGPISSKSVTEIAIESLEKDLEVEKEFGTPASIKALEETIQQLKGETKIVTEQEAENLNREMAELEQEIQEIRDFKKPENRENNIESVVADNWVKVTAESAQAETGHKDSPKSMLSKDGATVDQAAHVLWEEHGERLGKESQDFRNEIITALNMESMNAYKKGSTRPIGPLQERVKEIKRELRPYNAEKKKAERKAAAAAKRAEKKARREEERLKLEVQLEEAEDKDYAAKLKKQLDKWDEEDQQEEEEYLQAGVDVDQAVIDLQEEANRKRDEDYEERGQRLRAEDTSVTDPEATEYWKRVFNKPKKKPKAKVEEVPLDRIPTIQKFGVKVKEIWQAFSHTFFATKSREASFKNAKGEIIGDGQIRVPEEATKTLFAIQRNLLRKLEVATDNDSANITLDGIKGIYLTAMNVGHPSIKDKLPGHLDYNDDSVVTVVTDGQGNPINFDPKSGAVAKASDTSIFAIYAIPSTADTQRTEDNIDNAARSLATMTKQGKFPTPAEIAVAREQIIREVNGLNVIKGYVNKNKTDNSLRLKITGGSMGYIETDIKKRTDLANIDVTGMELHIGTPTDAQAATQFKKGRTYIKYKETAFDALHGTMLELERPTVKASGHAETLKSLLFDELVNEIGDPIDYEKRRELVRLFTNLASDSAKDRSNGNTPNAEDFVFLTKNEDGSYNLRLADWNGGEPIEIGLGDPTSVRAGKAMFDKLVNEARPTDKDRRGRKWNRFKMNVVPEKGATAMIPTIEDGVITYTETPYIEFIQKSKFQVNTQDIGADKKLRRTNSYMTFEVDPVEDETIEEETTSEEVKAEEVKIETQEKEEAPQIEEEDLNDEFDDDEFDEDAHTKEELLTNHDVKSQDVKATKKQIAAAKEWYENHPLKKYIPFKEMFNTINKGGVATWAIDGITLYAGSDYAELYHEAFHGFTQMMMTKAEKKALYNEVRKKSGLFKAFDGKTVTFKEASDKQIEEHLAVEFRKYMLSGQKPTKGSPKQNSWFRKIWNVLKTLFTDASVKDVNVNQDSNAVVHELFEKLRVGDIKGRSFSAKNAQFGTLNSGIVSSKELAEGSTISLNFQDSNTIKNMIDAFIAERVDARNSRLTVAEREELAQWQTELLELSRTSGSSSVRIAELEAKVAAYKKKATYQFSARITKSKDLLEDGYRYAKNRLGKLRRSKFNEMKAEDNPTLKAQLRADYLMLKFAYDNFGDPGLLSDYIVEEGADTTDVIGYHMAKSKVFLRSKELFGEEANEDNTYVAASQGMTRSGNESSLKDMAKDEIVYLLRTLPKMEKDENGDWNPVKNRFGVTELADFTPTWNRLARGLQNLQDFNQMYDKLGELAGEYPVLKELMQRMGNPSKSKGKAEHGLWTNFFQAFSKTRIPLIQMAVTTEIDASGNQVHNSRIGEAFNADFAVGRDWQSKFTAKVPTKNDFILRDKNGVNRIDVNRLLKEYTAADAVNKPFEFYRDLGFKFTDHPELKAELERGVATERFTPIHFYTFLKKVQAGAADITEITTFKELVAGAKQNTRYKALMILEATYSDQFSNFMVTNAEGNTQFEHSLNNTLTMMVNGINNAKNYQALINQPQFAHLNIETNPFSEASIWMRSMFNLDVDPTHPEYGTRIQHKGQDIKLKLSNLSGVLLNTKRTTEKGKVIEEAGDGISSASADEYTKLILDLHLSHAGVPELMRHADKGTSFSITLDGPVKGTKTASSGYIPMSEFRNSSDYKLNAVNRLLPHIIAEMKRYDMMKKLSKDENAANYDFIYMSNSLKEGEEFYAFRDVLSKGVRDELIKTINEEGIDKAIKSVNANKSAISNELTNYFDQQYDQVSKILGKAEFITDTVMNDVVKAGVPKGQARDAVIRSYVYNSWIHNIESISILYGDLAQYNHDKEGFHKRNAGAGSTGTILRTDKIMQDHINNDLWDSSYSKSLGIQQYNYTGRMDTAIVEDMNVKSVYFEQYNKVLTAAGKEAGEYGDGMNEADAQGLITFDAYRQMKVAEGTWSDAHDALYNAIVAGEEVPSADVVKFFPVIKGQYWGPLQTKGLPVTAFHKYSLFPMIPNVIKGKKMEALHKKMLKENIGYLTFESGSKVGIVTKNKSGELDQLFKEKGAGGARTLTDALTDDTYGPKEKYFTPNTIHLEYFKNQLEIHDERKGNVIFSTQLRKLVEDGLMENGVPSDFMSGKDNSARMVAWNKLSNKAKLEKSPNYSLLKAYEANVGKLTQHAKDKLLKEINWKSEKQADGSEKLTGDIKNLLSLVKAELTRQDLGDHAIDFIDDNGNLRYDISLNPQVEKIEKLLNALMVKKLVKQKVNGEGLIQVASTLMEDMLQDEGRNFKNPTLEDIRKWGSNDLPTYYQALISKYTSKDKINIYAGTNENAELSNFAERTYTDPLGVEFKNVEAGFQYAKLARTNPTTAADRAINDQIAMDLQSATGAQAKSLGRKIKGLDINAWDKQSSAIMKSIIYDSFEQNPDALNILAETGQATLTHTQDKGKWGRLFPKLLMEVRDELVPISDGKTTAMKVKIALNGDFLHLLKATHIDGKAIETLERLNEMIKNDQWLNTGENRQMITMVGVRIPVQGMNSMEFMEVYEFLHAAAGSVIIPPTEIVTKSGADFDVDKMTVMMPNISTVAGKPELHKQDLAKDTEENLKANRKKIREDLKAVHDKYNKIFKAKDKNKEFKWTEEEAAQIKGYNDKISELNDQIAEHTYKWQQLSKNYHRLNIIEMDKHEVAINKLYADRWHTEDLKLQYVEGFKTGKAFELNQAKKAELEPLLEQKADNDRQLNSLSSKAIENDLIMNIKSILELPQNFVPLITPNTTDKLFYKRKPGQEPSLAEELSEFATDYNPYDNINNPNTGKISPTRVLEVGYNLHKHKVNAVGKDTLGLGAVDNTYNSLFNRIGGYMNPTSLPRKEYDAAQKIIDDYEAKLAANKEDKKNNPHPGEYPKEAGQIVSKFREQNLKLNHNKLNVDGETVISLSHLQDANGSKGNAISDVVNQMINGWVDVAAEAWIFNVQGNKEISPSLLFMIQAGVPLKEAVYFVSNPIIREYVKEMKQAKSTFGGVLGKAYVDKKGKANPNFFKNKARAAILTNPKFGFNITGELKNYEILEAASKVSDTIKRDFNEGELKAAALTKADRDYDLLDRQVFAHFLEIEEMANSVRDVKMRTNVDTSRDVSLYEAQSRLGMLAAIEADGKLPSNIVDKIQNESPIGSFFIQSFQIDLLGGLFPLRNHKEINKFITEMISSDDVADTYQRKEIVAANWKSDLVNFMFQNELRYFNLDEIQSYGSRRLNAIKTTKDTFLNYGAFVKDGKMYIDRERLKYQWDAKEFKTSAYSRKYKLARIPQGIETEQEYYNFVLERETLRAHRPLETLLDSTKFEQVSKEVETKVKQTTDETDVEYARRLVSVSYEVYLRNEALTNTYNHHHLFKSDNTFGQEFNRIREDYPGLSDNFELMTALSVRTGNGMKNLALNNSSLEGDDINVLHENLKDLQSMSTVSAILPEASKIELQEITDFFKMFEPVAFLQSGMNQKSSFALTQITNQHMMVNMLAAPRTATGRSPMSNLLAMLDSNSPLKDMYLAMYNERFLKENSAKDRGKRVRGKNYFTGMTLTDSNSIKRAFEQSELDRVGDPLIEGQTAEANNFQGTKKFNNWQEQDAYMRSVSTGSIVEFGTKKKKSSTLETLNTVGEEVNEDYVDDRYVGHSYTGQVAGDYPGTVKPNYGKRVMLARTSGIKSDKLSWETERLIREAHAQGAEFIVGDMPGVDDPYVHLLAEINAKWTLVHYKDQPLIPVPKQGKLKNAYNATMFTQKDAQELTKNNPENTYVFNLAVNNPQNNAVKGDHTFAVAGDNTMGLPSLLSYGKGGVGERADLWRDDTVKSFGGGLTTKVVNAEAKELIDAAIDDMKAHENSGQTLIFSEKGYGQELLLMNSTKTARYAPKTFVYLSEKLYENFGYLNPGYLRSGSGSEFIQSYRDITGEQGITDLKIQELKESEVAELSDEAVTDFMKQCLS